METRALVDSAMGSLPPPNSATPTSEDSTPKNNDDRLEYARKLTTRPSFLLSKDCDPAWRERVFRLDTSHHPAIDRMAEAAERFCRRYGVNDRESGTTWLVLSGNTGCGKTHIARKVWRVITDYAVDISLMPGWGIGGQPVMLDWADVAAEDSERGFDAFSDLVKASQVVILDDVGSEVDRFKNGQHAERLRRILSLCERKWLLLTTNLTRASLAKTYDGRVADRMERARWVELHDVPSYRHKLRGKA